jgi:hypothetical protein
MNPVEQEPPKTIHVGIGGANTKEAGCSVAGSGSNALFGPSDLLQLSPWDRKLAYDSQRKKINLVGISRIKRMCTRS